MSTATVVNRQNGHPLLYEIDGEIIRADPKDPKYVELLKKIANREVDVKPSEKKVYKKINDDGEGTIVSPDGKHIPCDLNNMDYRDIALRTSTNAVYVEDSWR